MIKIRSALFTGLFILNGCAVIESRELFVTCRAADTYTTIQVIRLGGVEMNPIFRQVVMGHHWFLFIAMQTALSWFVWEHWGDVKPELKPAINVISCLPPINNFQVIKEQKVINAREGR